MSSTEISSTGRTDAIDPKNDVQMPCKAKHEERTQRNTELDEFY